MSLAPSPSVSRGAIIIQPSYFTSSLYINPLRDDISILINAYSRQYTHTAPTQPFALFKTIWSTQGWSWMQLKVFDARSRDTFLRVTCRLFLERMRETEPPINRVASLFALYTFFSTQPTTKAPSLHVITHIEIPIDQYASILKLPETLTDHLAHLQPHTIHILSKLIKVFYILPASNLGPFNPRDLPREIFTHDIDDNPPDGAEAPPTKKKGRPTKRDKRVKAIKALQQVDKWLEKNSVPSRPTSAASTPGPGHDSDTPPSVSTHILMSNPPTATLHTYRAQKMQLLDAIAVTDPGTGEKAKKTPAQEALEKANQAVLVRLKKLDRMAAEKGLELGSEGGERTGLERVEKAVAELDNENGIPGPRGGILGLLEGGGIM